MYSVEGITRQYPLGFGTFFHVNDTNNFHLTILNLFGGWATKDIH